MLYELRNHLTQKYTITTSRDTATGHFPVSRFVTIKKTLSGCLRTFKTFLNTSHFLTITLYICLTIAVVDLGALQPMIDLGVLSPEPPNPTTIRTSAASAPSPASTPTESVERESNYRQIAGKLRPGDTLSTSFKRHQVTEPLRGQIINALKGHLNFKDLRPNDHYAITMDEKGDLVKCVYESGPLNIYSITKTPNGYHTEQLHIPLERQTVKISGIIQSSLFAAFAPHGEDPKLIYAFADIFASQIDFNTETRKGDRFNLVFEKYYKDDQFVGYGKILVARYETVDEEVFEGFYYSSEQTPGSYFDASGRALGSSFIRSPVPMGRVTSRFSFRRKHPISGVVRPHLGVDLAAPTGTPIMAAADGRVTFVGWNGGYGKQVILKHGNGYKSYYGHLSRFAKGLKAGTRVKQKEIIGYVGSTGLSTGPHLDYRLQHNGAFKNPFAMKFKPKTILEDEELKYFQRNKEMLANLMHSLDDDHKVIQVNNVTITPNTDISFL